MDKAFDPSRRRFLTGFLRDKVVRSLVCAADDLREAAWRMKLEAGYESELRAFGPDILMDTARRSGIEAKSGVDYAGVAKTLANDMAGHDDGSQ
jgi:hypothetical protein